MSNSWSVKRKSVLWISIMLLVCLSMTSMDVAKAQDAEVKVEPATLTLGPEPNPVGTNFTVNITVYDVTELYGWEFKLHWDNTVLSGINDEVHVPPDSNWDDPNNFLLGPGIEQDYNTTHGRYYRGLSAMPIQQPHPIPYNGTTMLVTLTFEVLALGETNLELFDTKLADFDVGDIQHTASDGSITVIPEFPIYLILPLFLFATLAVLILGKTVWSRKHWSPVIN